jgi:hypothetical protein
MTIQELIDSLKNRKPAANALATNNTPDVAALQKRISETRKQVAAIFTQAQRTPVAAKLVACVRDLNARLVAMDCELAALAKTQNEFPRHSLPIDSGFFSAPSADAQAINDGS